MIIGSSTVMILTYHIRIWLCINGLTDENKEKGNTAGSESFDYAMVQNPTMRNLPEEG